MSMSEKIRQALGLVVVAALAAVIALVVWPAEGEGPNPVASVAGTIAWVTGVVGALLLAKELLKPSES